MKVRLQVCTPLILLLLLHCTKVQPSTESLAKSREMKIAKLLSKYPGIAKFPESEISEYLAVSLQDRFGGSGHGPYYLEVYQLDVMAMAGGYEVRCGDAALFRLHTSRDKIIDLLKFGKMTGRTYLAIFDVTAAYRPLLTLDSHGGEGGEDTFPDSEIGLEPNSYRTVVEGNLRALIYVEESAP